MVGARRDRQKKAQELIKAWYKSFLCRSFSTSLENSQYSLENCAPIRPTVAALSQFPYCRTFCGLWSAYWGCLINSLILKKKKQGTLVNDRNKMHIFVFVRWIILRQRLRSTFCVRVKLRVYHKEQTSERNWKRNTHQIPVKLFMSLLPIITFFQHYYFTVAIQTALLANYLSAHLPRHLLFCVFMKRRNRSRHVWTLYIRHFCYPTEIRFLRLPFKSTRAYHVHGFEHHYCADSTTEGKW